MKIYGEGNEVIYYFFFINLRYLKVKIKYFNNYQHTKITMDGLILILILFLLIFLLTINKSVLIRDITL